MYTAVILTTVEDTQHIPHLQRVTPTTVDATHITTLLLNKIQHKLVAYGKFQDTTTAGYFLSDYGSGTVIVLNRKAVAASIPLAKTSS